MWIFVHFLEGYEHRRRWVMGLDLAGKVGNTKLPLTNGLYPVFEAISNSIHAIDEASEEGLGRGRGRPRYGCGALR